MPEHCTCM